MKFTNTKKPFSEADKSRGLRQLKRLETIIDVLFGLLIFRLFLFLPKPEIDGFTKENLVNVLTSSYLNYLVIIIGIVLILIYWGQSNLQLGNMERTDGKHAVLSILQVVCLMIYLYFIRLDMEFDGISFALKFESIFLALAGFLGVWGWYHAINNNLISEVMDKSEQDKVYLKLLPEPITAVLTFPFATFGPDIWTLSWLLMIPVSLVVKKTGLFNFLMKGKGPD